MFSIYMTVTVVLSALLSFAHCSSFPTHDYPRRSAPNGLVHSPKPHRQLKAVRAESQIAKRDIGQALRCEHELHYVDGKHSF